MIKVVGTKFMALIGGLAFLTACATTDAPATSPEGLVLQPDTKAGAIYLKPGASLKGYQVFGVTDCEVAFRKNWLRDQNSNRLDLSDRVTQEDVDRIKDALSEQCESAFRAALQEAPPYTVVDEFENGEQVLVLRPSIVNLDIAAPDTMSTGISRSYTTSAGEMTLILEMLDATTGELLVRVIDKKKGLESGRMQWTNSVTNRADADRALNSWAKQLRSALDNAAGM